MKHHQECRQPMDCSECTGPCCHDVAGPAYMAEVRIAAIDALCRDEDDPVVMDDGPDPALRHGFQIRSVEQLTSVAAEPTAEQILAEYQNGRRRV